MRKFLSLCLVLLIVFTLFGCISETPATNDNTIDDVDIDDVVLFEFEGVFYEEIGVGEGYTIYLDTSANFEQYDPTYIITKTTDSLVLFESTLIYENLHIYRNGVMYSLSTAIDYGLLTYDDLLIFEKVGYHNTSLEVDLVLKEEIIYQRDHLDFDSGNPEEMGTIAKKEFLSLLDSEYSFDEVFFYWPAKYEWNMNMKAYYDLLEHLVDNGYIQGTLVKIADFVDGENSNEGESFSYYANSDFSIQMEEKDGVLKVSIFKNRPNHYSVNNILEVSTNTSYIIDEELIMYSLNQIYDEHLNEIYRYLEEWREFNGVARVQYDNEHRPYYGSTSSGFSITSDIDFQWDRTFTEYGRLYNQYKVYFKQNDEVYLETYLISSIDSFVNTEKHYLEMIEQEMTNDNMINILGLLGRRSYIRDDGAWLGSEYSSDIVSCYDMIETKYLQVDLEAYEALLNEFDIMYNLIMEYRHYDNIEERDDDQENRYRELTNILVEYEFKGETYDLLYFENTALSNPIQISTSMNEILALFDESNYTGLNDIEKSLEMQKVFTDVWQFYIYDTSIITVEEGLFPVLNVERFNELFTDEDGFPIAIEFYYTYSDGISGPIQNDSDAILEAVKNIILAMDEHYDKFGEFSEIDYASLSKEDFIEATNQFGFSFGLESSIEEVEIPEDESTEETT